VSVGARSLPLPVLYHRMYQWRLVRFSHSSFITRHGIREFTVKPGAGQIPLARYLARRDLQYLRRLFHTQAPKVSQLDDLALARVNRRQALQRVVQRNEFRAARLRDYRRFIERDLASPSSALGVAARAGIIHQNLSHQLSGNREELGAVLPAQLIQINQT